MGTDEGLVRTRPGKSWASHLALLIAPALMALASGWLGHCRRPFFHWVDPDYPYLLSALTIAELAPPKLALHPGTPLQTLGGVLLRVVHVLSPGPYPSLRAHVLADPEPLLGLWRGALVALCVVVLAAAGLAVLRITHSLAASLLFQLMPLVSLETLFSLSRVQPEPLLLGLGIPIAAILIGLSVDPARWDRRRTWVLLGLLAGLGLATKLTLLPLALLPVVTLTRAGRSAFGKIALASFCVALIPAIPEIGTTVRWHWSILTHTGYYGAGAPGLLDPASFPQRVWRLACEEWVASLVALSGLALSLTILRRQGGASPASRPAARTLLACSLCNVAWLMVAGKHARPRYLLPLVLIASIAIVLNWVLSRSTTGGLVLRAGIVAVVVVAVAGQPSRLAARAAEIQDETRRRQLAASIVESEGERIIQATPVVSVAGAMQYAYVYVGDRFSADLKRLYPAFTTWDHLGLNAFGMAADPARVMTPLPGGGAAFRLMGIDDYPVVKSPPAGVSLTKRIPLGRHVLFDGRVEPCAGASSGPFGGFFESFGLRTGGPESVGLAPRTRLLFTGNGRPMTLELQAHYEGKGKRRIRISVNGERVGFADLSAAVGDPVTQVRFDPRPGVNEAELEYRPLAAGLESGAPAALFRLLRLRCES